MKFFIDTANIEQIQTAYNWGILDGVTTNPTHVSAENMPFQELIEKICNIVKEGDISVEVVGTDCDTMCKEAREFARWANNIVIKIPLIPEGVKATKILSSEGIRINSTLCFSPMQALIAAKAGAAYVSPFVGRLDVVGHIGMDIVRQIRQIYDNYGYKTEIIVAAVRHVTHVLEAALEGADVATMRFNIMEELFKHPLTDIGLETFLSDWKKYQETIK